MKDSYVFNASFDEALRELPDKSRLKVYDAVSDYALRGIEPKFSGMEKAIFTLIKAQIDQRNQRVENGKKGGRKKQACPNDTPSEVKPYLNHTLSMLEDNFNKSSSEVKPYLLQKEKVSPTQKESNKEKNNTPEKDKYPSLSPQGEGEKGEKSAKARFFETYPTVWANLRYFKGDDSIIDYNVLLERFAKSTELRKKYSFSWIVNNYGGIKAGVFDDRKEAATEAADAKSNRDSWYARRRQQAISNAERVKKKLLEDYPWYADYEQGARVAELALAKAEVAHEKNPTIETAKAVEEAQKEVAHFQEQKESVLELAGLTKEDLEPKYDCEKCSDTGFLPSGLPCDCYEKEK